MQTRLMPLHYWLNYMSHIVHNGSPASCDFSSSQHQITSRSMQTQRSRLIGHYDLHRTLTDVFFALRRPTTALPHNFVFLYVRLYCASFTQQKKTNDQNESHISMCQCWLATKMNKINRFVPTLTWICLTYNTSIVVRPNHISTVLIDFGCCWWCCVLQFA